MNCEMKIAKKMCKYCGKLFRPSNYNNIICSDDCKWIAHARTMKRYDDRKKLNGKVFMKCTMCGKELGRSGSMQRYCGSRLIKGSCAFKANRAKDNFSKNKARLGHKYHFQLYRRTAKKRGYPFFISVEDFLEFWQKPCFYCGNEIKTVGIDRIDNDRGYVVGNMVACCRNCNMAKRCETQKEFLDRCLRIVQKHILFTSGEDKEKKKLLAQDFVVKEII